MSGADILMTVKALLQPVFQALGLSPTLQTVVYAALSAAVVFNVAAGLTTFLVWMERKVSAHMQSRIGPKRVGPFGLLQTVADAIKLTIKEDVRPAHRDKIPYFLAPIIGFVAAFMGLVVIPFDRGFVVEDLNVGILYVVAITGFSVIGILMAGWSSNNKFSLLGGFRSAAQIVSYEVPLVLSVIPVIMVTGTLSLHHAVEYQAVNGWWFTSLRYAVPMAVAFMVFLTSATAEANRAPFDIPEAESELVAGFHTEYSGVKWAMFFLGEYIAVVVSSCVAVSLFLGGWLAPPGVDALFGMMHLPFLPGYLWFLLKLLVIIYFIMAFRWTFPRLRVDQLMDFGWKVLIPIAVLNILLTGLLVLGA